MRRSISVAVLCLAAVVAACGKPTTPPDHSCAGRRAAGLGAEQTTEIFVAASADDAYVAGTTVAVDSNELRLGDENGQLTTAGVRVLATPLPPCAEIRSAVLAVTSASDYDAGVNLAVVAERATTPADFSGRAPNGITDVTTTEVSWAVGDSWKYLQRVSSPELTGVFQELVDADGWNANRDVVLRIDSRSVGSAGSHRRVFAWDRDPAQAPSLRLTYAPLP